MERSPFARADLEHELLMVDDDMKMEALKSTHYLKSLITAEMPMDLERKGEQNYQGQMYVRFLAFSNGDLESLYDHSDGFYRRQLILSVKKKPPDRADDPFLADKLCGEIEGIFLWCLEGLRRLQANSFRFTESTQTKANREDARQEADNVLLFLRSEGYIHLKADSTITSANLYAIYTMWCSDNAYKPLAARTVSMTLKSTPTSSVWSTTTTSRTPLASGSTASGASRPWSHRRFYERKRKKLHPIHPKHPG